MRYILMEAQFANALDWLWENCKEGDQAIIYFSGHDDVEKKSLTQPGFLLCWDAPARVYMAGGAFALVFLEPATAPKGSGQACADAYYERLMQEPKLARLALDHDSGGGAGRTTRRSYDELPCLSSRVQAKR